MFNYKIVNMLGGLVGGIASIFTGAQAARDSQTRFDRQMEENARGRQWELDMWNRANAYNHPMQQMERLRAAGLNPNLVYGNGADVQAKPVGSPSFAPVPELNRGAPLMNAIAQTADISMKDAQKDLMAIGILKAKQEIAESGVRTAKMAGADTNLVNAQTGKVIADTSNTMVNTAQGVQALDQALKLQETVISQADATLKGTELSNAQKEIENLNLPAKQKMDLAEARQRIINMKKQGALTDVTRVLEDLRLDLRKKGIEVSDDKFWRIFSDLMPSKGESFKKKAASIATGLPPAWFR